MPPFILIPTNTTPSFRVVEILLLYYERERERESSRERGKHHHKAF